MVKTFGILNIYFNLHRHLQMQYRCNTDSSYLLIGLLCSSNSKALFLLTKS